MYRCFKALAVVVLLGLAAESRADFSIAYSFTGQPGSQVSTPVLSTPPTGVSFSSLTRGTGLTANAGANSMNSSGFGASFDALDYYEFTIAPTPGFLYTVTSVTYQLQRSNTGPSTVELRSSRDSLTTPVQILSSIPAGTGNANPLTPFAVNLDSSVFAGLTTSTTFRLYGYNAGGSGGTLRIAEQTTALPGLVVNFDVQPVPEPSSIVLTGLGLAGLTIIARRRTRSSN